jgi:Tol biopolymer transport system component
MAGTDGVRHAKALLPYALASVAVVVLSSTVVLSSLQRGSPGASAPAVSAPVTRAELSPSARVAFWRADRAGVLELWVGDLDGSRRWTIARESETTAVAFTRWSPGGGSVAYIRDGVSLDVIGLDGTHASLPVPSELRSTGWRIASFEWSPSGARVAATLRPAGGASRESDVFVAEARAGASWKRLTTIGDAVAGQWIDDARLFLETGSGMIGILEPDAGRMRPITAAPAASPIIGRDGRVYFTGGEWARGDLSSVPYAAGNVWSMTIEGEDLRREDTIRSDQMRLQGRLADGRFILGTPGSSYIAGAELVPMPWRAGNVRRVVLSADGRRAIGFTDSRVVRLDPTKINEKIDSGAVDAASVLLDGARAADVWFAPARVELAHAARATDAAPGSRLAFVLGRVLWQMDPSGEVRELVSAGPDGWLGAPSWSPTGERLAVTANVGWPKGRLVMVGPSGRWESDISAAHDVSWSPDGARLAVVTMSGERLEAIATLILDAASGRILERLDGIRAKWTEGGLVAMDQGEMGPDQRNRVGQTVFVLRDGARVPITSAGRLAAHPLLRELPDASLPTAVTQLLPSSDGRHLGVWLYRVRAGGFSSGAFVALRVADGEVLAAIPFDPRSWLADVAWSPVAPILARTVWAGTGPTAARKASVTDLVTGRVLAERDGTFAGWSPEGDRFYVARNEGLFAYPLAGGDPVRISALGVKVVAARR